MKDCDIVRTLAETETTGAREEMGPKRLIHRGCSEYAYQGLKAHG